MRTLAVVLALFIITPALAQEKPAEREAKPEKCPTCSGTERVKCKACRGTPKTSRPCGLCKEGRTPCPGCLAEKPGRQTCAPCSGAGKVAAPCPKCSGSGSRACERCNKGWIDCPKCKRRGYLPSGQACDVCFAKAWLECPECRGTTKLECPKEVAKPCRPCEGRGTIVCADCKAKGTIACSSCNGTAKIEEGCTVCERTGFVACECKVADLVEAFAAIRNAPAIARAMLLDKAKGRRFRVRLEVVSLDAPHGRLEGVVLADGKRVTVSCDVPAGTGSRKVLDGTKQGDDRFVIGRLRDLDMSGDVDLEECLVTEKRR